MSEQAWALTGVAIGAIVGGGAQAFADLLQARRASRIKDEDVRRHVYQSVLSAFRRLDVSILVARTFYDRQFDEAGVRTPADATLLVELTDRVMTDVAVLREAVARGDLDASVDVHRRIGVAYNFCIKLALPTGLRRFEDFPWDDTKDQYIQAFREMRAQMRAEVGRNPITGDAEV
jgi:hypothetical protein